MMKADINPMLSKVITFAATCLLIGMIFALSAHNKDFIKQNDPYEYGHLGKSIWAGQGLLFNGTTDVVLSPGFPILIGAADMAINDLEWSGKIISIVSFVISTMLVFKLSFFFLNKTQNSVFAAMLFASNSGLVINASSGYSESFFTLFFLALTWLTLYLCKQDKLSLRSTTLFSLMWATLYYIRPEGMFIGTVLFMWLTIKTKTNKRLLWFMPFIFAILIFPYMLFLKNYTGYWQLSGKTYLNLVMGELNSPYQKENAGPVLDQRYKINERIHKDPSLAHGFAIYLKESGNDIIQRIMPNLIKWAKIYWFTFSIVGIAFWIWGIIKLDKTHTFFLLSLLIPACIYLLFFILPRSIAIYNWICIIFIIAGFNNVKTHLESKLDPKYAIKVSWALILFISLYQIRSAAKMIYDYWV